MRRCTTQRVAAAIAVGALAALLSACAGDSNSSSPTPSSAAPLTSPSTALGSPSIPASPLAQSSVTDFGAKGDGKADDTQAIMAAAAAGPCYVPAGTYLVTDLQLPEGTVLIGEGERSRIVGSVACRSNTTLSLLRIGAPNSPFGFVGGTQQVTLDRVVFSAGGDGDPDSSGVIEVNETIRDVHFFDCVIERNRDGVGNGVKMIDNGVPESTLDTISFVRCRFAAQPRMGLEVIARAFKGPRTLAAYHDVQVIDCVFEPQGSEALSFDGPGYNLLVQGCRFKGSGTNDAYPWRQMLELNGSLDSSVLNNRFDRAGGWWLNCTATRCLFVGNTFDSTSSFDDGTTDDDAQAWGGTYMDCTFSRNQVKLDTGAGFFWFSHSRRNRMVGNTFTDIREGSDRAAHFQDGSSRNLFVGNSFTTAADPAIVFMQGSTGNVFLANKWQTPGERFRTDTTSSAEEL